MKKINLKIGVLLIAVLMFCCRCAPNNLKIEKSYYLSYFEGDTTLAVKIENNTFIDAVGSNVFELSHNNDFILVKQHPKEFSKSENLLITNYYIIPLKHVVSKFPDINVIGPLTKKEFDEKFSQLSIPSTMKLR